MTLFIGVFLLLPIHALADQLDDSVESYNGINQIVQFIPPGSTGTVSSFTFKTSEPFYWAETQWPSGFATFTQCDAISDYGIGGEDASSCTGRVRHAASSASYAGDFVTVTFGTPIVMDPSKEYIFAYYGGDNSITTATLFGTTDPAAWPGLVGTDYEPLTSFYYVAGISSGGSPTGTRIISVFPPDDPTYASPYATSTVFDINGTGFVAEGDYVDGMVFRQRYFNNVSAGTLAAGPSFSEGGNILCNALPAWLCPRPAGEYVPSGTSEAQFDYPIDEPGDFSFATTSSIQVLGNYTLVSQIIRPSVIWGFIPGGDTIYVGTTTHFQVVAPSSFDQIVGDTIENIQDLQDGAAPECSFDFTAPSNFFPAISKCIVAIMQPAYDVVIAQIQTGINNFLSRAPWGYGRLVYIIVTDTSAATTTLPTIGITVPEWAGNLEGHVFDFSPWYYMGGPGSYLATQYPDFLALTLEWWGYLCWALWAIAILAFFLNINNPHHDDDD